MRAFIRKWLGRHTTGGNRVLHILGIAAVVAAPVVVLFGRRWLLALGLFVGGYLLQILGHALEGTPVGEWLLLKRLVSQNSKPAEGKDEDSP